MTVPSVHAAGSDVINVGLVGCGGRGTGAAANALSAKGGPLKLVAMADVFKEKLDSSYDAIKAEHADKIDVPEDRKFIGFDGFEKAIDCVGPGGIVMLTTPPAFRWVQFAYAIEKGLNRLRREGPSRSNGPSTRKMLSRSASWPAKKGLQEVGVGLMLSSLRGPRRETFSASDPRTARSATLSCSAPTARPARSATFRSSPSRKGSAS